MGQVRHLFKANQTAPSNSTVLSLSNLSNFFFFNSQTYEIRKCIEYQMQDYSPHYPLTKQQQQ